MIGEGAGLQVLAEVLATDPRLKYKVEEARLCIEGGTGLTLAAHARYRSLQEFLESQRQSSSTSCQLLHLSFSFSQPILLEVGTSTDLASKSRCWATLID
jgi:hypothetical protein